MRNPLRFSLSALIGVILLVSLYLAAMRESTTWGAAAALTLSVGLLALGLLWAVLSPSADRQFWRGFQLCGWGYLLVAFSAGSQAPLGTHLITTRLASEVHGRMPIVNAQNALVEWHGTWYPAEVLSRRGMQNFIHYTGYGSNWDEWVGPNRIRGQFGPFLHICHSLMSLVMALAGGIVAGCIGGGSARWFWILWGCGAAVVVAASLLGMIFDSDTAASVALSMFLAVLVVATLAAWRGAVGGERFAIGFAIVGWGYLALHFGPGLETGVGQHLLSTRLIQQMHNWLHPSSALPPGATFSYVMTAPYGGVRALSPTFASAAWYPSGQTMNSCVLAGHALLATVLGLVGGLLGVWISRKSGEACDERAATVS